ncbi:TPA: hypothetical protein NJ534_001487 [Vibrio parahaemolyticus]|nr:hypothetical protein [Vibrio parahaemolyticus]
MGLAEVISAIALVVACWALKLQRNEIIKNGRISALSHTSNLLQQKIDFHSKIIDALKKQGKDFKGHSQRVNDELRPLRL